MGYHVAYLAVGVELPLVASCPLIERVVELRKGAGLDAPGRIVGQVPVEEVNLILREKVNLAFQLLDGNEVAPRIVHKAAPAERRPVDNPHVRHQAPTVGQLAQGLVGPNFALTVFGRDAYSAAKSLQNIPFGRQVERGVDGTLNLEQRHEIGACHLDLLGCGYQGGQGHFVRGVFCGQRCGACGRQQQGEKNPFHVSQVIDFAAMVVLRYG